MSETFRISHPSGSEATVSLHGGHVISWKTADGIERLFLSELAEFEPEKAIRGGIPVIFPQFSDHGPFGRHGFARKSEWSRIGQSNQLTLKSTPETLAEWPHEFTLELEVSLSEFELQICLKVENPGTAKFEYHAALHTYLKVADIGTTSVEGLQGRRFLNEVTKLVETDSESEISFRREVDRAYFGAGELTSTLLDGISKVEATANQFPDIVVWNPGLEHGIGDLPSNGWKDFVCIEAAQMHEYETLKPGNSRVASQALRVIA